jgi:hypothetical protein
MRLTEPSFLYYHTDLHTSYYYFHKALIYAHIDGQRTTQDSLENEGAKIKGIRWRTFTLNILAITH